MVNPMKLAELRNLKSMTYHIHLKDVTMKNFIKIKVVKLHVFLAFLDEISLA